MKILVLGGTSEARGLAAALLAEPEMTAITSLAGRVVDPVMPVGDVRIGGFGGADALALWLRVNGIDAVVDATHPFADRISSNVVRAASASGVPLVVLGRPPWSPVEGDRWIPVPALPDAAAVVPPGGRVFLTIGRQGAHYFAGVHDCWFLVRAIDPLEGARPRNMTLLLDRGPFTVEQEVALMREYRIDVLVTKNSGGSMTEAKLTAARELGVPVIMVDRPEVSPAVTVRYDVPGVLGWLHALL